MNKILNLYLIILLFGCANIVAPTGGEKDVKPPRVLNVSMAESNKQNTVVVFEFDEYIQFNKWEDNFFTSPPLKNSIKKDIKGKKLILTIEDTMPPLTHYVSLNYCIKDNNEGNILDKLAYRLSTNDDLDTLTIKGNLRDAYTLEPLDRAWVMLFDADTHDTLIFNSSPSYIAKTDSKGDFYFTNLTDQLYKIVSVSDGDFVYDKNEKIAFLDSVITAKKDSLISLFAFKPIDTAEFNPIDTVTLNTDSIALDSNIQNQAFFLGSLQIITKSPPCIFQLLHDGNIKVEIPFNSEPYVINKIPPGEYELKYILDTNKDSVWNTGSWKTRNQPEKVLNYPSKITIRSNWDLELDWIILE